jgi:hypothetical protein
MSPHQSIKGTDRGAIQIEEKATELSNQKVQTLVNSLMTRSIQSAAIVGRWLELPIHVEVNLRKWSLDTTGIHDTVSVVAAAFAE